MMALANIIAMARKVANGKLDGFAILPATPYMPSRVYGQLAGRWHLLFYLQRPPASQ